MKLLYCPECKQHTRTCYSEIAIKAKLKLLEESFLPLDYSANEYWHEPVTPIPPMKLTCVGCNSVLEMQERETCPHESTDFYWKPISALKQKCLLCGAEREGRLVFD